MLPKLNLRRPISVARASVPAVILMLLLAACRQDMHDQPKYEPLEQSGFFGDQRASRLPVEGTVARGELREDTHYFNGKVADQPATTFPMKLDNKILARGQRRYNILRALP